MELKCALGEVLGPVSLSDSDDTLEIPAREKWFPVGTNSLVGVKLMMESAGVVAYQSAGKVRQAEAL